MSYLTQMLGLATHNFWSAATGIALAVAFIRGIARREMKTLGNFWVDITRATLWVLLPLSIVLAFVLVSQGVIQNLRPYDMAQILEPQTQTESQAQTATGRRQATSTIMRTQTIAQGPVASQEAIKMLGTNGGGFFNANSAHPFENPTPLQQPAGDVCDLPHPRGSDGDTWADDRIAAPRLGCLRCHGGAMVRRRADLLLGGIAAKPACCMASTSTSPQMQAGGNMEGKEVRFGIANSALFAT